MLYYIPQYATTTLSVAGGINKTQTTGIVLASVPTTVDKTKPGIICVTWADPINTDNAEWITYTSIDASNELQGVTRAAEGFSAKTHDNGAVIAWVMSASHINGLYDAMVAEHNTDGTHKDITATTVTTTGDIDSAGTVKADTIAEHTAGSGVTADGVLHKDNTVILPNNSAYKIKDSGGTARNGLKLNSSDVWEIGSSAKGWLKLLAETSGSKTNLFSLARQGGDANIFGTGGNNNYIELGNVFFQFGVKDVGDITAGSTVGPTTITFPISYSTTPLVIGSIIYGSHGEDLSLMFSGRTTTKCDIWIHHNGTVNATSIAVGWLAIGKKSV